MRNQPSRMDALPPPRHPAAPSPQLPELLHCHAPVSEPQSYAPRRASFSFQSHRLVGVIPYAAGARQITATFDSGFSSCTASVIKGHSVGTIRRKGPDGMMYEISSGTTSSPSSSIQSGNAFAGQ